MILPNRLQTAVVCAALAAAVFVGSGRHGGAQKTAKEAARPEAAMSRGLEGVALPEPSAFALPLPEDRGQAAVEQSLKRLGTTASVLMIVAHPDDEDGALLTYLSRGLGVRCTLLTLNRGEGGQNAMSADSDDALGLIRTNELLKAGEYYGRTQLWGTEADFGFSKTQEESFAKWGHERVLFDAVLAVRRERPQIIVSTFSGAVTDGHGHHQVAGEIAQEAFKAAADPKLFPEQFKPVSEGGYGLTPWQPLAVYSMVPFAPVTEKGMFDYATGKWAPVRFHNYVTGEWTTTAPSPDATLQVGGYDPALGRSYMQIAREGWGQQKSQNGGANPVLSGPGSTSYHLWAAAPEATAPVAGLPASGPGSDLFQNSKVRIDTGLTGLARLEKTPAPQWLSGGLSQIAAGLKGLEGECLDHKGTAIARKLAPVYRQTLDLRAKVAASDLSHEAKAGLLFELDLKIGQFQTALKELLGLDLMAFTARSGGGQGGGPFRGQSADEMPPSVSPGEEFLVRVHAAQAAPEATRLSRVWLESHSGGPWQTGDPAGLSDPSASAIDAAFHVRAAEDAKATEPYFTRPSSEQPYYDLSDPQLRERSFVPYPLAAWAEFTFEGLPIRLGQVVQTMHRVPGTGGVYEPLVVTPPIGVRIDTQARILPLDGSPLPVKVTVHSQGPSEGSVELKLPEGWVSEPSGTEAHFRFHTGGDSGPFLFSVTPAAAHAGAYALEAVVHSGGHDYRTGWQSIGYPGMVPYNLYRQAELRTRKIDVKVARGLRVGYIMGTGDTVPDAIEALGVPTHVLTPMELAASDFSGWNVLVVGIRAYSALPGLGAAQPRLDEFVRQGGTLIVLYQGGSFPAPLPLTMGRFPERVVDEQAPVKLLEPANSLLSFPNAINEGDFDGWLEERGHGFLESWDSGYTALTQTADPGQDPQRGGLLVAHPGKGRYIYIAFALHRQLPELVPGAYRLLANLLSAGAGHP